jgi:hypothetical protein
LFSPAFTGTMNIGTTGARGESSGATTGDVSAAGGSGILNSASALGV